MLSCGFSPLSALALLIFKSSVITSSKWTKQEGVRKQAGEQMRGRREGERGKRKGKSTGRDSEVARNDFYFILIPPLPTHPPENYSDKYFYFLILTYFNWELVRGCNQFYINAVLLKSLEQHLCKAGSDQYLVWHISVHGVAGSCETSMSWQGYEVQYVNKEVAKFLPGG